MSGNSGFKITINHVLNTLYLAAIGLILVTAYWVYSAIQGFFFPPPKVTSIANAELIGLQVDDTLITSRAHIDSYLVLQIDDNGEYRATDDPLSVLQSRDIKLKEKRGDKYRQLCVYSLEVHFGYENWNEAVAQATSGGDAPGWPTIVGIFPKRRLVAPDTPRMLDACRGIFSGSMADEDRVFNAFYIRHWLDEDRVYRSHIEQGINQLVDIALWESSLSCQGETCEAAKTTINQWREYQLAEVEDPILVAMQESVGRSGGSVERSGLPLMQAAPIRGVYKETYSSLVFVNAKGRLLGIPFTSDNEMAMQRDVIEVTYGSTIYYQDAVTLGGETTIYASLPRIVMKSLTRSEHAVVPHGRLDELRDVVGMSVSDYLQNKTNEMIAQEVEANQARAVQTAKTILRQKISILKTVTQQGGSNKQTPVSLKFTDVPPDEVGFSDLNLTKFLSRFQ